MEKAESICRSDISPFVSVPWLITPFIPTSPSVLIMDWVSMLLMAPMATQQGSIMQVTAMMPKER